MTAHTSKILSGTRCTFQTFTHELAPGLLLTVQGESRGYWEEGRYYEDEMILDAAILDAFGAVVDLLEGCPMNEDAYFWLAKAHPQKSALVDLAIEKGRMTERDIESEPPRSEILRRMEGYRTAHIALGTLEPKKEAA